MLKGKQWVRTMSLHWENWLFAAILAVGILVRTYRFGSVPPPLNIDETSAAYDAFALLHYGIDRNGFLNPVVLVAWGRTSMQALQSYLMMPFMALLGVTTIAIRAPSLLLNALSLIALPLLFRRRGDVLWLLVAWMIAISPAHIIQSRWALESNIFPPLFLLATYFLCGGLRRRRWLIIAGLLYGATIYSYGTSYVFLPLFLALSLPTLIATRKLRVRGAVLLLSIIGCCAIPALLFLLINRWNLASINEPFLSIPRLPGTPRFVSQIAFFSGNVPMKMLTNFQRFLGMLASQNDRQLWNIIPAFGIVYAIGLPLAACGLVADIRRFGKDVPASLLLCWTASVVVLGAILVDVNVNRLNIMILPLAYYAARGTHLLRHSNIALAAVLASTGIFFAQFAHAYFTWYPDAVRISFIDIREPIRYAARETTGPVCVTSKLNPLGLSYIYVLLHLQIDPRVFVRTVRYDNPGDEFRNVAAFDRYTFGIGRCPANTVAYVLDPSEKDPFVSPAFAITYFPNYLVATRTGKQ